LKVAGISAAALAVGSNFYLNDEKMERAPIREGRILADLHTHPSSSGEDEETLEMLCAPGIVGLSYTMFNSTLLTYENCLERFSGLIEEIDKGMLARIKSGPGYIARTQEFHESPHHILGVGFEGGYIRDHKDSRKSVEEIHKRGGIAILNHPYATPNKSAKVVKYRFINAEEEKMMRELCDMVDEVEIFNSQCINPTLGIIVPNMKKNNRKAEILASEYGFKGTVSTDAHRRMDQPKICGIYLGEEGLCTEKIMHDIRTGNFDNDYKKYVSRYSFARGMFLG